ncbi:hypothetical protein SDC9_142089 [bioreactor metagenome]|uniref:Uncharacterized protein n=1 Tax=bioreactor metagenome TaxID=1076179 RepID=A0A645DZI4_9ZZZZ|nr:hypothetical protein [Candidatus Pelethousia sp.]
MELTREYQQYILDVLADLRGEQLGVKLKYTIADTTEETEVSDELK